MTSFLAQCTLLQDYSSYIICLTVDTSQSRLLGLTPYSSPAVVPTSLPELTPYPLSLMVPLGRSCPFFRLHSYTQRFRATHTLAPHCGHNLKLRELIRLLVVHSHTVPDVRVSKVSKFSSTGAISQHYLNSHQIGYSGFLEAWVCLLAQLC